MTRRVPATALAVAALVAALGATACSAAEQPPDQGPSASVAEPEPAGVTVLPNTAPATTAPPNCDATASLRPLGALPPPGQMPANSTMERIFNRGRLVAGVDQSSFLFGFRDPFSGAIEGFDVDMIRQVAQAIFGDPNRVQYVVVSSADRVPALQRGAVDIVARTFTVTCDRLRSVSFSSVYYQAGQRVLVRKGSGIRGLDELGGRRVCAANGTTSVDYLAQAPTHPVPVAVVDWGDCLVLLQQNQVDAISTDDAVLAGMVAQDPYTEVVGPRLTDEPYGIAVQRNAEDFVRFVNAVLERMRADGTWAASYQRWLAGPLGPSDPPPARYRD
jgi:polar amino acid transport system substrate-binding protein